MIHGSGYVERPYLPLLAKPGVSVAVADLEMGDVVQGYEADEADALQPFVIIKPNLQSYAT